MARTVPFDEAAGGLAQLLDELDEPVTIVRDGRAAAVLVSSEEHEALTESLELLGDAAALESLRESELDVRVGRMYPLDEVIRELGGR